MVSKFIRDLRKAASDFDAGCLIAARISLLAIALLSASLALSYQETGSAEKALVLFTPIAMLFGFSALSALWVIWRKPSVVFTWLQFTVDVLIVTGIIYVTGGPHSPFLVLYLPLVMAAAFITTRVIAFALSLVSLVAYSTLVYALINGWIQPIGDELINFAPGKLVFQLVGMGCAMFLVSVAVAYLRKSLKASQQQAEESRKNLRVLDAKHKTMLEGFPEGIIITDQRGGIASVNNTARTLFEISEETAIGQDFYTFMKSIFPKAEWHDIKHSKGTSQFEIDISKTEEDEEQKILFSKKPILTPAGERTGDIFLLEDITRLRSIEKKLDLQEKLARMLSEKNVTPPSHPKLPEFVGESRIMQKVFQLISKIALADATVLITGESGTGKELVAKSIHLSGERAKKAFVAINCGAIPENLIESHLFGHKKGSFTGAYADQSGVFEQAEGGTVFLDEIGELPMHLQAKLLRALQEKTIRPVGAERDLAVDVRIVSATNKHLKDEINRGTFREDLYYRLNVIAISLPPLRDRKEDIPLLVNAFLKRLLNEESLPVVSPESMQNLMDYDYKGNVRELENILERAVVLGGDVILPEHLPEHVINYKGEAPVVSLDNKGLPASDNGIAFPVELETLLQDLEKKYLEAALLESNGVKKHAAELLGINFRSFRYRLQKFGIND